MSLERIIAGDSLPVDLLSDVCLYMQDKTNALGGFIAISSLDYFDIVKGTMRWKRKGGHDESVSMPDLIRVDLENGVYLKAGLYVYRTYFDWYVGLDFPMTDLKDTVDIIKYATSMAYAGYNHILTSYEKAGGKDVLTGLLTRKMFYDDLKGHIKSSLKTGTSLWVFYMDFNNFKLVNDYLTHAMGDRVLTSMSAEMRSVFKGRLYRIGGDEFCGIAQNLSNKKADTLVWQLESISEQAPCGLYINLSVGAYRIDDNLVTLNDFKDKEKLDNIINKFISKAEEFMYNKKSKKRNLIIACENCPHKEKNML